MKLCVRSAMVLDITAAAWAAGCGGDGMSSGSPSSDLKELQDFARKAGEGYTVPGMVITEREFSFPCNLYSNPYVNDHPGLFGVSVNGHMAYVVAGSPAGAAIQKLLGDGGRHVITVRLGKPRQRIGNDGIVEIV